jgi:hypothetical protein
MPQTFSQITKKDDVDYLKNVKKLTGRKTFGGNTKVKKEPDTKKSKNIKVIGIALAVVLLITLVVWRVVKSRKKKSPKRVKRATNKKTYVAAAVVVACCLCGSVVFYLKKRKK